MKASSFGDLPPVDERGEQRLLEDEPPRIGAAHALHHRRELRLLLEELPHRGLQLALEPRRQLQVFDLPEHRALGGEARRPLGARERGEHLDEEQLLPAGVVDPAGGGLAAELPAREVVDRLPPERLRVGVERAVVEHEPVDRVARERHRALRERGLDLLPEPLPHPGRSAELAGRSPPRARPRRRGARRARAAARRGRGPVGAAIPEILERDPGERPEHREEQLLLGRGRRAGRTRGGGAVEQAGLAEQPAEVGPRLTAAGEPLGQADRNRPNSLRGPCRHRFGQKRGQPARLPQMHRLSSAGRLDNPARGPPPPGRDGLCRHHGPGHREGDPGRGDTDPAIARARSSCQSRARATFAVPRAFFSSAESCSGVPVSIGKVP